MKNPKKPVLQIRNIKKSFLVGGENVDVLKGVNLEVNPGEFIIIIGPSGCGKSTLLNTILGLEKPDEGEVLVFGESIYDIDGDERATFRRENFGIVHQQPNWIKSLNVIENVAFPLSMAGILHKKAIQKTKNMLYLFKFDKKEKYNPAELSGGEQQKLSVCRALITDPPIILADEPTGNLDSVTAEDLMYDLKLLNNDSKKTFVMVTHNPDYERYATKFVYMEDGAIKSVKQKVEVSFDETLATKEPKKVLGGSSLIKLWFLIKLVIKNFKRYKMRTLLTSGGVALSIGFITFLVALSYGFQELSTDGIRNIEEFKMLDVDTGKSKITSISEGSIDEMSNIFGVEKVYPSVSLAGDFSLQDKEVTGIVYGMTSDTLKIERPKVIMGKSFSSEDAAEVLLNSGVVKGLGIDDLNNVVGQSLDIKTITRPELLSGDEKNFKSESRKYKVVGMVDEGDSAYAYVPLGSLKKMGIVNYSEAKVKTTTQDNVDRIKSMIENMGYKVSSVKDTVDQANQFFGIFRMILLVFGIIAVAVSSIGMFNTLTISLVEKTREIGIMKSIGATNKDVKKLFLLEALFVGVAGGMGGITLSYFLGLFFNTSIYALAKSSGNTPIEIFIFPLEIIISALILSVVISVLTGFYPSSRASKMSALDALRYE